MGRKLRKRDRDAGVCKETRGNSSPIAANAQYDTLKIKIYLVKQQKTCTLGENNKQPKCFFLCIVIPRSKRGVKQELLHYKSVFKGCFLVSTMAIMQYICKQRNNKKCKEEACGIYVCWHHAQFV